MPRNPFLILLSTLWMTQGVAAMNQAPHPALLGAAAELERRAAARHPQARIEVSWQPLASVITQRECHAPELKFDPMRVVGSAPIRVHCRGDTPWSFFARARVHAYQATIVARQAIPRGTRITPGHVETREVEITNVQNTFHSAAEASRYIARRPIRPGAALTHSNVALPPAVQRGESVRIVAEHGAATISTTGVALQGGKTGDQISVRNTRSGKVIRTWIRSVGTVATRP